MSSNWPKAGPNNVNSYQLSGIPYVTGSTGAAETIAAKEFKFPYVTRFVTLSNSGNASDEQLILTFTANGSSVNPKNNFICPVNSSVTLDVRCKSVFITTTAEMFWSLCGGLTMIPTGSFPVLSGSNGFKGIG